MTTKPSVQALPRERAPEAYDARNEQRYRSQVDDELLQKFDKRSNLVLGRGKSLVLSSSGGVQFALSLSDAGIIVVTDVATGDVTTVTLDWTALANRPANLVALTGSEGIVTSANVAAGIAGQGALATLSAVTWATQVTGVGRPEDYATYSRVFRQDGSPSSPNTNDIWVVTTGGGVTPIAVRAWNGSAWVTGADITSLNTAAAITGQGWGATASEPAASNAVVPVGSNLLLQANFNTVATYYQIDISAGSDTRVTGDANGIRFRESLMSGTPASGTTIVHRAPTTTVNMPIVTPGQRLSVSCLAGCTNLSSVELLVLYYDSALGSVSPTATVQTISSPSLAGGGALTTWHSLGGVVTVPANAHHAMIFLRGYCNGSAAPRLRFARPMMAHASAAQTTPTTWSAGFIGQPGADVTATNTAAAITGQGALATLSTVNTAQIASGAVSTVSSAYTSGTTGGTAVGDGWTRHQSVTITSAGGTLIINAAIKGVIASDVSNASQSVRIRRGTTTLYDCSPFNQVVGTQDTFVPFSATISDAPAAGTYTYYIETTFSGASISRNEISNRALVITELRR